MTAREKLWNEKASLRKCMWPLVEISSPGHDELRACPSLERERSSKTILEDRLWARRCDCSFVFAVPVQTLVGELLGVAVGEVGARQRFQAAGVFPRWFMLLPHLLLADNPLRSTTQPRRSVQAYWRWRL